MDKFRAVCKQHRHHRVVATGYRRVDGRGDVSPGNRGEIDHGSRIGVVPEEGRDEGRLVHEHGAVEYRHHILVGSR
jgi:hypothetical protein